MTSGHTETAACLTHGLGQGAETCSCPKLKVPSSRRVQTGSARLADMMQRISILHTDNLVIPDAGWILMTGENVLRLGHRQGIWTKYLVLAQKSATFAELENGPALASVLAFTNMQLVCKLPFCIFQLSSLSQPQKEQPKRFLMICYFPTWSPQSTAID